MLQTTNYGFPICEAADKGGWLSTFNNAMNGIDAALKTVENSVPEDTGMTPAQIAQLNEASEQASSAKQTANSAMAAVNNVQAEISALSPLFYQKAMPLSDSNKLASYTPQGQSFTLDEDSIVIIHINEITAAGNAAIYFGTNQSSGCFYKSLNVGATEELFRIALAAGTYNCIGSGANVMDIHKFIPNPN